MNELIYIFLKIRFERNVFMNNKRETNKRKIH
jgi:hypothetical protein